MDFSFWVNYKPFRYLLFVLMKKDKKRSEKVLAMHTWLDNFIS